MPRQQRGVCHTERLGARLHYNAAPRTPRQVRRKRRGSTPSFLNDLTVAAAHANLRFPST
jgi:hypothetical protein